MNRRIFIVTFLIITTLIAGCKKKNKNIGFTGNVFEPNIQSNISYADVILSAQLIESGTWNTNYTKLQTTTTDSEGKFELEVESQRVSNYRIAVSKDGFFENYYNISPDLVGEGEVYNDTYNIYSAATLVLNIKNIYPVDSLDKIIYSIEGQTSSCSDCCSTSEKTFIGEDVNEFVTCKLPGHQTIKIEYYIIRQGNTQVKQKSIYLSEFETKNVDLFY